VHRSARASQDRTSGLIKPVLCMVGASEHCANCITHMPDALSNIGEDIFATVLKDEEAEAPLKSEREDALAIESVGVCQLSIKHHRHVWDESFM